MAQLVMFGGKGCHLCDMVEAEIRSIERVGSGLTVVDVGEDQALLERYLLRIPVVTSAGKEVFEARMMDLYGRWKEKLRSALEPP